MIKYKWLNIALNEITQTKKKCIIKSMDEKYIVKSIMKNLIEIWEKLSYIKLVKSLRKNEYYFNDTKSLNETKIMN